MKFADILQSTFSTVAAGVTLGTSSNPNSLNNQTCSPAADAKAPSFPQINLGTICITQVHLKSWNVLTVVVHAIFHASSDLVRCTQEYDLCLESR